MVLAGSAYIAYDQYRKFFSPYADKDASVTAHSSTTTTIQDLSTAIDDDEDEAEPSASVLMIFVHTVRKVASFIRLTLRVLRLLILFTPVIIYFGYQHYLSPSSFDSWCRFLVHQMQKGGPCFIKLAQWAGTRKDLFGDTLTNSFSAMHSNAPSHSFAKTRRIIESEFKKPLEEVFSSIEPTPLASGAIAQVYTAIHDGAQVAVKVRHPGVVQHIARDLSILQFFTKLASYYPPLQWAGLEENISIFSKSMVAQTDMRVEATNLVLFQENFKSFRDTVRFPTPDLTLTTHQVLVETFERGTPIQDYLDDTISNAKYTEAVKQKLSSFGMNMYLKMMLVDNFVHADMHPGNLLVDQTTGALVVLDAGLVTKLKPKDRVNFMNLFSAVAAGDGARAAAVMIETSRNANQIIQNKDAVEGFKKEMKALIDHVIITPMRELEVGVILEQVLSLGRKYKVPVDSNFTSMIPGMIVIEGIGKQLNRAYGINFIESSKPFLVKESAVRDAYIKGVLGNEHPQLYKWYEQTWKSSKWNKDF
ncbi:hypothetical protein AKO1_003485 [Acrasis kona]|uniref:Protein kinase domain-containing protein n=1 Tax=Acrasis kona TaxID=1008807 RepID=A0AAW2Z5Z4_9EUKA